MLFTCPFCFQQFTPQEMRFRCANPFCQGAMPDEIYANARGYASMPMGRILIPAMRRFGQPPGGVICDECRAMSYKRVCPYCHQELSEDIGQIDQRIIAIIGGPATGKTHYIASLVNRLKNEVAQSFGVQTEMMNTETELRWERDFYTPLFVRKMILQPTRRASIDPTVRAPLMFRFIFSNGSRRRAINISFFDSAGEDIASDVDSMAVQNRYICHADGIIFLLDPLQIPTVRHQLSSSFKVPLEDFKASPEVIVGKLRRLLERQQRLHPTQKVKVPIAFTLSKVDTLTSVLDATSALQRPSNHPGWLDLDDVQALNTELSHYLTDWINPAFIIGVRNGFACYNFFGVSSLGESPDANNHLSTVSPLRVEDPFLWLLYKLGLVKGRR